MGRRKKTKYRDVAASKTASDTFGTVFESMCKDKDYQSLSIGARQFYTLCRVQSQSKEGKACLYRHALEFNREYSKDCFVFPSSHLELYGMNRANAARYFKELEAHGFIRKVEKNNAQQKVNVYEFLKNWYIR